MCIEITQNEYNKLIEKLHFYDNTRNNLLTFSFTAVLAILGIALTKNMNLTNVWLCLIPFFLIIPFSARISYYRLASAHVNSFLRQFAPKDMQFEIGSKIVKENGCSFYRLIAWMVNHEMLLLSIATSFTFYIKYWPNIDGWKYYDYISFLIPLLLTTLVYLISHSTYSYKKLTDNFEQKWKKYIEFK